MPRILFVCRNFGYPLGGVRTLYRHVRILVDHGLEAYVLLRTREEQKFFPVDVPTLPAEGVRFSAEDHVVLPEPWNDSFREMMRTDAKRYVFCQNHYYMFHGLMDAKDWSAYGVTKVIASGETIAAFIREVTGVGDVPILHYAIDQSVFRPLPKRRQIAVMPRKGRIEATVIRHLLRRRHPRHAAVPFAEIDMMPEAKVAEILGQSAVFLSLSRMEGFGMPPIEAMAAGCMVVGFHGGGGLDYARPENGLWCAADDLAGAADALARALDMLDGALPGGPEMLAAAKATADGYSIDRTTREVVEFWRAETAG